MTKKLLLFRIIPIKIGGKILSAVVKDFMSSVTFQYAYPSITVATINTAIQINEFFIFTFSFFLCEFSKFINLYLEIVIVLKNITATYITAKYTQVFMHASFENTNSNLLIFASNNLATAMDINCDANIPHYNSYYK